MWNKKVVVDIAGHKVEVVLLYEICDVNGEDTVLIQSVLKSDEPSEEWNVLEERVVCPSIDLAFDFIKDYSSKSARAFIQRNI